MVKRFTVRIEGTDNVKEELDRIINNLTRMKQDIIRLELEPLRIIVGEEEVETPNTNN